MVTVMPLSYHIIGTAGSGAGAGLRVRSQVHGQDLTGLAATSDLKRFLATVPVERATPPSVTVMLSWQAALTGR